MKIPKELTKPLTGRISLEKVVEYTKTAEGRVVLYAELIRHGFTAIKARKATDRAKFDNAKLIQSSIAAIGNEMKTSADAEAVKRLIAELEDIKAKQQEQSGGITKRSSAVALPSLGSNAVN